MSPEQIEQEILSFYPPDYRTEAVTPLFPSASLGACRHWMIEAPEGTFCLRRWPKGQKNIERLQFTQAVLWHAVCEGVEIVPLPLETLEQKGIVVHDDSFWELLPWVEGIEKISSEFFQPGFPVEEEPEENWAPAAESFEIASAMISLAQLHEATASFPIPDFPRSLSTGIKDRLVLCATWISGRLGDLQRMLEKSFELPQNDEERRLARIGLEYLERIVPLSGNVMVLLSRSSRLAVPVQPTIRNASFRHLRFDEDGVCGMIDLTELGVDSVTLDVATLLGSLAGADAVAWNLGLKAYQSIRLLDDDERYLIAAFDASQTFLEGLGYLETVFLGQAPLRSLQLLEIERRLKFLVGRLRTERRNRRSA